MLKSKAALMAAIKVPLPPTDAQNVEKLDNALGTCLDDLAMRYNQEQISTTTTIDVDGGESSVTLDLEGADLREINFIAYDYAGNWRVLDYLPPERFLREWPEVTRSSDYPTVYTIEGADEGVPILRFNYSLPATVTFTLYYFPMLVAEHLHQLKGVSPLVPGTQAYFYGLGTELGRSYYAAYQDLVRVAKGNDRFRTSASARFEMSKEDEDTREAIWRFRNKR